MLSDEFREASSVPGRGKRLVEDTILPGHLCQGAKAAKLRVRTLRYTLKYHGLREFTSI